MYGFSDRHNHDDGFDYDEVDRRLHESAHGETSEESPIPEDIRKRILADDDLKQVVLSLVKSLLDYISAGDIFNPNFKNKIVCRVVAIQRMTDPWLMSMVPDEIAQIINVPRSTLHWYVKDAKDMFMSSSSRKIAPRGVTRGKRREIVIQRYEQMEFPWKNPENLRKIEEKS